MYQAYNLKVQFEQFNVYFKLQLLLSREEFEKVKDWCTTQLYQRCDDNPCVLDDAAGNFLRKYLLNLCDLTESGKKSILHIVSALAVSAIRENVANSADLTPTEILDEFCLCSSDIRELSTKI
jgi:hypothetical protein